MEKKKPMRKCVGCGESKEKAFLIRVIRDTNGEIHLDPTGRANGRGAYICKSTECFEKARKARRFEKNFSCKIDESVYEVMADELRKETENG